MKCALCGSADGVMPFNLNWLNVDEPEVEKVIVEKLKIELGGSALVKICKGCIAEIRLST